MGADRTSREKTKSKKRHSSSASEDERKSKRRRTREEKERKSRKSDKKEKREGGKSHRHRSDKERKHKSKHTKDSRHSEHEYQELSTDDYFSKNNEFATWLKDEKSMFFSDLSSESARELFSDFVKAWNTGKLDSRFYNGIASGPRTSHTWKIKQ